MEHWMNLKMQRGAYLLAAESSGDAEGVVLVDAAMKVTQDL